MSGPGSRGGGLDRPLVALLVAALCTAAIVALARTAVGTASGQRLDQLILSGAKSHEGPLAQYAEQAVHSVSLPVVGALLALAAVLVLVRRRFSLLVPLTALVLGANLTTQVIKHVVVTREALGPGIDITPNSFPSGHTTLAATAMIAVVLAGGRARVVLAPAGALWTTAAGLGTLVLGWHRPSDVIGAITVVAAWTFLILAIDEHRTRRRARAADTGRGRRRHGAEVTGRGRRRHGAEATAAGTAPLVGRASAVMSILLGLAGSAGLLLGALGLLFIPLPLDLYDASQQQSAFRATAALIAGGTAAWMALVLDLRTPISHRTRKQERVP